MIITFDRVHNILLDLKSQINTLETMEFVDLADYMKGREADKTNQEVIVLASQVLKEE